MTEQPLSGELPIVWPVGFHDRRKEKCSCPKTDPESTRQVQTVNLGGARNTGLERERKAAKKGYGLSQPLWVNTVHPMGNPGEMVRSACYRVSPPGGGVWGESWDIYISTPQSLTGADGGHVPNSLHFQPAVHAGRAVSCGLEKAPRHRDADTAGIRWQDDHKAVGGAPRGFCLYDESHALQVSP